MHAQHARRSIDRCWPVGLGLGRRPDHAAAASQTAPLENTHHTHRRSGWPAWRAATHRSALTHLPQPEPPAMRPQWFASVEGFRATALEAIAGASWIPGSGENRITAMTEGRSDWCGGLGAGAGQQWQWQPD